MAHRTQFVFLGQQQSKCFVFFFITLNAELFYEQSPTCRWICRTTELQLDTRVTVTSHLCSKSSLQTLSLACLLLGCRRLLTSASVRPNWTQTAVIFFIVMERVRHRRHILQARSPPIISQMLGTSGSLV